MNQSKKFFDSDVPNNVPVYFEARKDGKVYGGLANAVGMATTFTDTGPEKEFCLNQNNL